MIDIKVLRAMAEAGATVEMILAAVDAAQDVERTRLAERRAKDAARKRRSRDVTRSHADIADVTSCHADSADPPAPPLFPPTPPYNSPSPSVGGGGGGDAQARDPDPPDRPEPTPAPALPAQPASLITPEAHALADELAAIAGVGAGQDTPPGWCGAAHRVQTWLSRGWTRDVVLIGARASMARKRDGPPSGVGYFEPAIAREIAGQAKPLPTVEPAKAEVIHGTARFNRGGGFAALAVALSRPAADGAGPCDEPATGALRAVAGPGHS